VYARRRGGATRRRTRRRSRRSLRRRAVSVAAPQRGGVPVAAPPRRPPCFAPAFVADWRPTAWSRQSRGGGPPGVSSKPRTWPWESTDSAIRRGAGRRFPSFWRQSALPKSLDASSAW